MNPNIKKRWIEALRSGKYKQAREQLYKPGVGFCCLGVLCDLFREEKNIPSDHYWDLNANRGMLPLPVANWAGVPDIDPSVDTSEGTSGIDRIYTLSALNDQGVTFDRIATLIEKRALLNGCPV